jgi:hypothetical protein
MKHLQTVGGVAALCLSALFISLLVIAVVLPSQGYGQHMLDDPTVGIRFLATSGLPVIISLLYIGTALVFVPLTLALQHRFLGTAPALMQVAVAASLIASSAWLAYGMINIVGTPTIVSTYQHSVVPSISRYV